MYWTCRDLLGVKSLARQNVRKWLLFGETYGGKQQDSIHWTMEKYLAGV